MEVSKDFVPYLNVTASSPTPLEGIPDQGLLGELGGGGFPSMVFIEPETGAVLTEHYWRPADEASARKKLGEATAAAKELQELAAKAAQLPEDQTLQATLALRLALMHAGDATLEELRELSRVDGLDPELKAEFDAWYAGALVKQVIERAQENAAAEDQDREQLLEAIAAGFYAMLKDGVRLPADHESAQMYYDLGLNGAVAAGDAETAQVAFDGLSETLNSYVERDARFADRVKDSIADARQRLESIPPKDE